jgi:Regulator of chromosome condensation (RCC1) repeat
VIQQCVMLHLQETELAQTVCIALLCCHDQGYGNNVDVTDPLTAKDVLLGTGVYATVLSAGAYTTCAILSNRQLLCWGSNDYGKTPLLMDSSVTLSLINL